MQGDVRKVMTTKIRKGVCRLLEECLLIDFDDYYNQINNRDFSSHKMLAGMCRYLLGQGILENESQNEGTGKIIFICEKSQFIQMVLRKLRALMRKTITLQKELKQKIQQHISIHILVISVKVW